MLLPLDAFLLMPRSYPSVLGMRRSGVLLRLLARRWSIGAIDGAVGISNVVGKVFVLLF